MHTESKQLGYQPVNAANIVQIVQHVPTGPFLLQAFSAKQASTASPTLRTINCEYQRRMLMLETYLPCFSRTTSSIISRSRSGNIPARVLMIPRQPEKKDYSHILLLYNVLVFYPLYSMGFCSFRTGLSRCSVFCTYLLRSIRMISLRWSHLFVASSGRLKHSR